LLLKTLQVFACRFALQVVYNILVQNFITIFLSIIIESLPFVTLGVLISVLVALFVSEDFLRKILPKNTAGKNLLLSLLGILFPVCQCGNIPVARRLLLKNFNPSEAMVFLLAAPVVNPITIATTAFAFPSDHAVVILRTVMGIVIANVTGYFLSRTGNQESFLTKQFYDTVCHVEQPQKTLGYAIDIFQSELLVVMRWLCFGALIAVSAQTLIPKSYLLSVGHNIYLSIFAFMALGFLLSLCSTFDAFFALAFVNTFTLGAIVSFLIFAPIIDIKMIIMMRSTFRSRLIFTVSLFVAIATVITGLLVTRFL
jgi:uncharacterized protein